MCPISKLRTSPAKGWTNTPCGLFLLDNLVCIRGVSEAVFIMPSVTQSPRQTSGQCQAFCQLEELSEQQLILWASKRTKSRCRFSAVARAWTESFIEWAANLNWRTKNSSGSEGYLSGIEPVGRHRAGFILLYILSQNTNGGPSMHRPPGLISALIVPIMIPKSARQVSPMVKLGGGGLVRMTPLPTPHRAARSIRAYVHCCRMCPFCPVQETNEFCSFAACRSAKHEVQCLRFFRER